MLTASPATGGVDNGVGRLLDVLEQTGVADDTLVIYTSDNGPWLPMGHDGGSAGPLRGGKQSAYEGGHRVPAVMRWPDSIPADTVCTELATTMDLLPTLASVAGVADTIPTDRAIDGVNILPLLEDPENAATPRDGFAYFDDSGNLRAVRDDAGMKYYPEEDELYDLHRDVGEQTDVSDDHPADVEYLQGRATAIAADLETNSRPVGNEPGKPFTERAEK